MGDNPIHDKATMINAHKVGILKTKLRIANIIKLEKTPRA